MTHDRRYEHALSAALAIVSEIDTTPGMKKHNRLALVIFSFLHAIDQWEKEKDEADVEFPLL